MRQKSADLHAIAGTSRKGNAKQQHAALTALDHVPSPPEWIEDADAREHWQTVLPVLVRERVVTEADLSAFGLLCFLWGKIVGQAKRGEPSKGPQLSRFIALSQAFGLTPQSRSKVHPLPTAAPVSGFSRYREDAHERE